jgi:ABC-type branched-subunit amino acid transport system ATPase component
MVALLDFDHVDAFYGDAHILHSLTFTIAEKERVALLGRNGVGKTTAVNALLGLATVRNGSVRVKGSAHRRYRPYTAAREGIAIVPQGRCIVPGLTTQENLLLGAAAGRKGTWTLSRVFDLFPVLCERADAIATKLSGGQQQMLAIGRALMANPDLLILDEPTEGLAPVIVNEIVSILDAVAAQGTAILLIEQHLKLVSKTTDRYYVLSKGTVVETGNVADFGREDLAKHMLV